MSVGPPIEVDYDERMRAIESLVRLIVGVDLPDLGEWQRESLVGHLTGALVVAEMEAHGR